MRTLLLKYIVNVRNSYRFVPGCMVLVAIALDTIAVGVADAGRDKSRFYGMIKNTPAAVSTLLEKLDPDGEVLGVCYEAGPYGYGLYRQIPLQWTRLRGGGTDADSHPSLGQGEVRSARQFATGGAVASGGIESTNRLFAKVALRRRPHRSFSSLPAPRSGPSAVIADAMDRDDDTFSEEERDALEGIESMISAGLAEE